MLIINGKEVLKDATLISPTISDITASDAIIDATLSGTPKIFLFKDNDGAQFYIKAYPTKS